MTLPSSAYTHLAADLQMCRVLNGMWQVSGGHGPIEPTAALHAMEAYHLAGFTTWDLADHYGPAEDFIGAFRRHLASAPSEMLAFTKWVPYPGSMERFIVQEAVDLSRRRMAVDTLDLLQFHWWDYGDRRYLDALEHLAALRDGGQIRHLALTNFDTAHTQTICAAGIRVISNQVQYSLVDRRPEVGMASLCQEERIGLLTYGTLCGGLLSERFLGRPEPGRAELGTASLQKYKHMIDAWGGWALFQELLLAVKAAGDKHQASIANIAVRAILDRPAVAGVIVGVRLGASDHREDNARVFDFELDEEDWAVINAVSAKARDLYQVIGDCGDEYR